MAFIIKFSIYINKYVGGQLGMTYGYTVAARR